MSFRGEPAPFLLALAIITSASAIAAEVLGELGKFSTFEQFNLTRGSDGKVVSA
jgi:hypothetical protein